MNRTLTAWTAVAATVAATVGAVLVAAVAHAAPLPYPASMASTEIR